MARDIDDGGGLLWIPDSKTEAGKRTLRIPEVQHDELLFGQHWRDWVGSLMKQTRTCDGKAGEIWLVNLDLRFEVKSTTRGPTVSILR